MRKRNLGFKFSKGNAVSDTILVFIVLFVFSLISFLGYKVFTDVQVDLTSDLSSTEANETITEMYDRYPSTFDSLFVVAFVLFWAMTLVASFMIDTHPIFFVFTIILLVFVFIALVILGNSFIEITEDTDAFGTIVDDFPMTSYIYNHFLVFIIVVGFSIAFVLFFKTTGVGT